MFLRLLSLIYIVFYPERTNYDTNTTAHCPTEASYRNSNWQH